jgi:hypothetical protein
MCSRSITVNTLASKLIPVYENSLVLSVLIMFFLEISVPLDCSSYRISRPKRYLYLYCGDDALRQSHAMALRGKFLVAIVPLEIGDCSVQPSKLLTCFIEDYGIEFSFNFSDCLL